jgi:uridine kinase
VSGDVDGASVGAGAIVTVLADRVRRLLADGAVPVVVGIDGRSGAGKSTLAADLARTLAAAGTTVTVIEGDQFYSGGSAATWDRRSPIEKAERVIDWRRQRRVLEDLRASGVAEWHPFDWEAADWDTDLVPLAAAPVVAAAADVVVLEGAYSCRPELHDLLALRVFLQVTAPSTAPTGWRGGPPPRTTTSAP